MKFIATKSELLKSLGHVQSVVEKRTTMPILSNVRIDAVGGVLNLTATDLDILLTESIPAKVQEEGATTVPAQVFYEVIRKIPDGAEISFDLDKEKNSLKVKAAKSRFSLSCLPAEQFPNITVSEFNTRFAISAAELIALIDKVKFAMSTEETRYNINGIYFHRAVVGEQAYLRTVATDGHRLAKMEVGLPDGANEMNSVIIPRKTILEFRKLLDESNGEVHISVSDTKIRLEIANAVMISKLIDGNFPEYERVIPTVNNIELLVSPKVLADAVDRVITVSSDKTRTVLFNVTANELRLLTESSEKGKADESIEIKYQGDNLESAFNSRYLLDILSQIEGEEVLFLFSDGASPVLIKDLVVKGAVFVIMPLKA